MLAKARQDRPFETTVIEQALRDGSVRLNRGILFVILSPATCLASLGAAPNSGP